MNKVLKSLLECQVHVSNEIRQSFGAPINTSTVYNEESERIYQAQRIFQEIMKLVGDNLLYGGNNENNNLLYRAFYCIVKISTFTDNLPFEFGKMFPEFKEYSLRDELKEYVRLKLLQIMGSQELKNNNEPDTLSDTLSIWYRDFNFEYLNLKDARMKTKAETFEHQQKSRPKIKRIKKKKRRSKSQKKISEKVTEKPVSVQQLKDEAARQLGEAKEAERIAEKKIKIGAGSLLILKQLSSIKVDKNYLQSTVSKYPVLEEYEKEVVECVSNILSIISQKQTRTKQFANEILLYLLSGKEITILSLKENITTHFSNLLKDIIIKQDEEDWAQIKQEIKNALSILYISHEQYIVNVNIYKKFLEFEKEVSEAEEEEAAKKEAARLGAERKEAARLEEERKEAARLEAARLEAARLEAARLEAARLEAARLEAARLEAARLEEERKEAARLEAERKETLLAGFLIEDEETQEYPIIGALMLYYVSNHKNYTEDTVKKLCEIYNIQHESVISDIVYANLKNQFKANNTYFDHINYIDVTSEIIMYYWKLKPEKLRKPYKEQEDKENIKKLVNMIFCLNNPTFCSDACKLEKNYMQIRQFQKITSTIIPETSQSGSQTPVDDEQITTEAGILQVLHQIQNNEKQSNITEFPTKQDIINRTNKLVKIYDDLYPSLTNSIDDMILYALSIKTQAELEKKLKSTAMIKNIIVKAYKAIKEEATQNGLQFDGLDKFKKIYKQYLEAERKKKEEEEAARRRRRRRRQQRRRRRRRRRRQQEKEEEAARRRGGGGSRRSRRRRSRRSRRRRRQQEEGRGGGSRRRQGGGRRRRRRSRRRRQKKAEEEAEEEGRGGGSKEGRGGGSKEGRGGGSKEGRGGGSKEGRGGGSKEGRGGGSKEGRGGGSKEGRGGGSKEGSQKGGGEGSEGSPEHRTVGADSCGVIRPAPTCLIFGRRDQSVDSARRLSGFWGGQRSRFEPASGADVQSR